MSDIKGKNPSDVNVDEISNFILNSHQKLISESVRIATFTGSGVVLHYDDIAKELVVEPITSKQMLVDVVTGFGYTDTRSAQHHQIVHEVRPHSDDHIDSWGYSVPYSRVGPQKTVKAFEDYMAACIPEYISPPRKKAQWKADTNKFTGFKPKHKQFKG